MTVVKEPPLCVIFQITIWVTVVSGALLKPCWSIAQMAI